MNKKSGVRGGGQACVCGQALPSNTIAGVFGIERTILFVLNDVCKFSTVHPATIDNNNPRGGLLNDFAKVVTFWGLTDKKVMSAASMPWDTSSQGVMPYKDFKCAIRSGLIS